MNGNLRRIAATDLRRIKDDEGFREALVGFGGMGLGDIAGVLAGLPWYLRLLFRLTALRPAPKPASGPTLPCQTKRSAARCWVSTSPGMACIG